MSLGDPGVQVRPFTTAYGGKQIRFSVKGNALYAGGLSRAKESCIFKGVLWHQGESNTTGVERYVSDRSGRVDRSDLVVFISGGVAGSLLGTCEMRLQSISVTVSGGTYDAQSACRTRGSTGAGYLR